MVRRSGRLKKKPRINYNEDSLWERATGMAIETWNKLVDIVEDPQATSSDEEAPTPPTYTKVQEEAVVSEKITCSCSFSNQEEKVTCYQEKQD